MTAGEFKDYAEAFESIALGFAVLFAGGWALFRFLSLKSIDRAMLELKEKQETLSKRSNIEIDLTLRDVVTDLGHFIIVKVDIRNNGNKLESFDAENSKPRATRVDAAVDGTVTYGEPEFLGDQNSELASLTDQVESHGLLSRNYLIHVPCPGLYFIEYNILCSPEATALAVDDEKSTGYSIDESHEFYYSAGEFYNIASVR